MNSIKFEMKYISVYDGSWEGLARLSRKGKLLVSAAILIVLVLLLTEFWIIPQIFPESPSAVSPTIGAIQPTAGYYLPFRGNVSKIFVVSVNVSSGVYPFDPRASMGSINGKPAGKIVVTKGEPCVVINVTLRNDYSAQNPPPNQLIYDPKYPAQAYIFMTAKIFNGNNEINSTDLMHLDLPPDAWSETWLNGGGTGTISIYLAITSHREITGFQLNTIWIGGVPLA